VLPELAEKLVPGNGLAADAGASFGVIATLAITNFSFQQKFHVRAQEIASKIFCKKRLARAIVI
jgi:hypothetical protein